MENMKKYRRVVDRGEHFPEECWKEGYVFYGQAEHIRIVEYNDNDGWRAHLRANCEEV